MKQILSVTVLSMSMQCYAQCPYPVQLNGKEGFCVGSTLEVASGHPLAKIVWYRDGIKVATNVAAKSYSSAPIVAAGGHGDGAAANQIDGAASLCVDAAGNIYVSDINAQRVQKWTPGASAGITLAGSDQELNSPQGIAVDQQGNVYVADAGHHRVQKYVPGAGAGITVAGGNGPGAAANQLFAPTGVYVDCNANLYITDNGNSRIQEWAPGATSGLTVAKGGGWISAVGLSEQVCLDGHGNIYVVDVNKESVRKWAAGAAGGVIVAGGNGAGGNANQFNQPEGMFVDYYGDMYICDLQNNRVQLWTPGATSGVAAVTGLPQPQPGFDNPWALFIDVKGNLYVSDDYVGGGGGLVLEWKMQPTIDSTYTATVAGKYVAVCTDMDGYPVTTDTVLVNNLQSGQSSIQISATATNINVCTPVTFTATTTGAGSTPSFQWQVSGVNAGTNSPTYTNNIFADGDKVLCILTDYASCIVDTSNVITLSVDPHGTASVSITSSTTSVCKGDSVYFHATVMNGSASASFQWLVNGVPIADDSASYGSNSLVTGDVIYCLITSDNSCGLAKSNSIPVVVNEVPIIETGQVFSIPRGTSMELEPVITGNVDSYTWTPPTGLSDPDIRNPVANPSANTLYTLSVVSPAGCKDSATILVNVFTPLSIPNAFTPNGDGQNDVFFVLGGPENSRIESFTIFNRWGQPVFQVHNVLPGDRTYGWNGSFHGQTQPAGTYVYIVSMQYADGTRQVYKGTVMLIR